MYINLLIVSNESDRSRVERGPVMLFSTSDDAPHLTCRELQILQSVARGRSAKEVAHELGIAPRTVERHIENARNKMRARNKTHMIAKAVIYGELILDLEPSGRPEPPLIRLAGG